MTAGCDVMLPSAAFLGLPMAPLFPCGGAASGPSAAAVWTPPPAAGVIATRTIADGVTSPPLSADDVTALRCDPHNFVTDVSNKPVPVDDLDGAVSWLSCLRLATNCHTHNVSVRRWRRPEHHITPPALPGSPQREMRETRTEPVLYELVTVRPVRPGDQLAVWFDAELSQLADVPFLGLRNIHGGGRYGCHMCGQLFQQPNPLKLHLAVGCRGGRLAWPPGTPTPPPPSPARVCAEVETLVSSMGRSSKGHVCLYCGKLYSRKYGLKIHIRTHTGYKPLCCRICARPFGDPSNLNKHVRLHADGETPYRCESCGKVLVRRRDLERHMRSRHGHVPPSTAAVTETLQRARTADRPAT